jgi:ATP-binding cassette subfamily B protein
MSRRSPLFSSFLWMARRSKDRLFRGRARRDEDSSARSNESLVENVRWALRVAWETNSVLLALYVGLQITQGFIPAAQALATRGLINTAVAQLRVRSSDLWPIVPWLVLTFAATLAGGLCRLCQDFTSKRLEDDMNLELNTSMLSHAATLDVGFFEDPASQDLLYLARQNSSRNLLRFIAGVLGLTSNLLQMLSLFAILVAIEPLVLLLTPAAIPYLWFQWRLSETKHRLEKSRATKRRWTQYFTSAMTDRSWVPEVKALGLSPLLLGKFRAIVTEFRDQDAQVLVRSLRAAAAFSAFATVALFALLARVALRLLRGGASVGDLAIFGVASGRLRTTLEKQVSAATMIRDETLNVSDLRKLLVTSPGLVAKSGVSHPSIINGEIEFEDVSFSYPGSPGPVLRGISLHIRPGETLALVGRNGSGKSTITKLIGRFYDPDSGVVRVDGRDLREFDSEALHAQISFVFQRYGRYEGTVAENIAYGDWRHLLGENAAVEQVVSEVGLDDMVESMPDGLTTNVGRRFGYFDLSDGQWQRLALTRAFARRAPIVILDEPSANLDPIAERELSTHFRALVQGRTAIIISHRFSTISIADRIAVIEDGQIVELGTHGELVKKCGAYSGLYSSQNGVASAIKAD